MMRGMLQMLVAAWILSLFWVLPGPVSALPQLVDQVVAVVDDEIVLRSEVMAQIYMVAMGEGLSRSDLTATRVNEMFGQILENMIQEVVKAARDRGVELGKDY